MPTDGATEVADQEVDGVPAIAPTAAAKQIDSIVHSLRARLGTDVDSVVLAGQVEVEFAAYSAARITQFIPALVESRVWARLCHHVPPSACAKSSTASSNS